MNVCISIFNRITAIFSQRGYVDAFSTRSIEKYYLYASTANGSVPWNVCTLDWLPEHIPDSLPGLKPAGTRHAVKAEHPFCVFVQGLPGPLVSSQHLHLLPQIHRLSQMTSQVERYCLETWNENVDFICWRNIPNLSYVGLSTHSWIWILWKKYVWIFKKIVLKWTHFLIVYYMNSLSTILDVVVLLSQGGAPAPGIVPAAWGSVSFAGCHDLRLPE